MPRPPAFFLPPGPTRTRVRRESRQLISPPKWAIPKPWRPLLQPIRFRRQPLEAETAMQPIGHEEGSGFSV